jgi:hypothetical protein
MRTYGLLWESQGKKPVGRPRRRWMNSNKKNLGERMVAWFWIRISGELL